MGFMVDERTSQVSGRVSAIWLALTQMGLAAIVLYRAYVLDQPDAEFADVQVVLFVSLFGRIFTSLYYGGHFPILTIKQLLKLYGGFVVFLFVVLSIWYGLPDLSDWQNNVLPVFLGPAIILGLYHYFAHLGQKRLEKNIES